MVTIILLERREYNGGMRHNLWLYDDSSLSKFKCSRRQLYVDGNFCDPTQFLIGNRESYLVELVKGREKEREGGKGLWEGKGKKSCRLVLFKSYVEFPLSRLILRDVSVLCQIFEPSLLVPFFSF